MKCNVEEQKIQNQKNKKKTTQIVTALVAAVVRDITKSKQHRISFGSREQTDRFACSAKFQIEIAFKKIIALHSDFSTRNLQEAREKYYYALVFNATFNVCVVGCRWFMLSCQTPCCHIVFSDDFLLSCCCATAHSHIIHAYAYIQARTRYIMECFVFVQNCCI